VRALLPLLSFAPLLAACATRPTPAPPLRYDWHFLYVMPYDNDLDRCAAPITAALQRGAGQPRMAVSVLYDGAARDGLRRIHLQGNRRHDVHLDTEDSADPAQVAAFLDAAVRESPARRYVLVFLDHGGAIDQMGYDERAQSTPPADAGSETRWLSARATGEVVRAWMRGHHLGPTEVPLVFFQQCGRASIEALLNFRGTGEAILASQRVMAACNTYYETLLTFAAAHPEASPTALAVAIARSDAQHRSLTLVRTAALDGWNVRADDLAAALLDGPAPPTHDAVAAIPACFSYGLESNYDLLAVTRAAATGRGPAATAAAERMEHWVRDELVALHLRRDGDVEAAGWCGVAAHVPSFAPMLDLYRLQPAYRESRWDDVARALAPPLGLTIRGVRPTSAR
jgi:hypothetical protein